MPLSKDEVWQARKLEVENLIAFDAFDWVDAEQAKKGKYIKSRCQYGGRWLTPQCRLVGRICAVRMS